MIKLSKKKNIKTSVIIPCYRCSNTIERAVKSVVDQSYKPYEVILIEDFSNDENKTINKLKELKVFYKNQIKIILINNSCNKGPGFSRNIGWEEAKGTYVAFLDSDDSWHLDKLKIQLKYIVKNSYVDVVCNLDQFNLINKYYKIKEKHDWKPLKVKYRNMLFKNIVSTRSVIINRRIKSRFKNDVWYSEDYALWLEILAKGGVIHRLPFVLSFYYKNQYSNVGLTSHLFKFFKSELSIIQLQPVGSWKELIIKMFAIIFCIIKFLKRTFIYSIKNSNLNLKEN
jgi:glycosyltransferase involved in cell wall biosynthesis